MYFGILIVLGLLAIVVAAMVYFKVTPLSLGIHKPLFQKSGVALDSFDPITFYFTTGPKKGVTEHIRDWNGASWFFTSFENAQLFMEDPAKYAPKYGGYCAKAIGTGFTGPSSTKYWTIYDHALFLFSSEKALNEFKENPDAQIKLCNTRWGNRS